MIRVKLEALANWPIVLEHGYGHTMTMDAPEARALAHKLNAAADEVERDPCFKSKEITDG